MNYVEIVNDAIKYIESNLHREIFLKELASRYYISPMHFYRIFQAVTNQTVKSYILGRKLSEAAIALKNTNCKVVDIAFQYGFNSHEQFTRNFQKMFHVTPNCYRRENIYITLVDRADIMERDFKNKNKDITVNYYCRELKEMRLLGKEILLNPWNSCELEDLIGSVWDFEEQYIVQGTSRRRLFSVNRSHRSDLFLKYCFYGISAEEYEGDRSGLTERSIPASKYAIFRYPDFGALVFRTVLKDLDKWLSITGYEFNNNAGIEFFELHTEYSAQIGEFYLHVPVL